MKEKGAEGKIAILLAAGLGTRMRPLTETIPKPLVKVQGVPLIETLIEGLRKYNIAKIYIVTGYLKEAFQYLPKKYSNVILIENKEYLEKNNISSLRAVGDLLGSSDCFICEADLYLSDADIFQKVNKTSGYFGKMVEGYSNDWAFIMEGEKIGQIVKGASDTYNMVGISYWNKKDAERIKDKIIEAYQDDNHKELFWDEIVDRLLCELTVQVYEVSHDSIIEIDTMRELEYLENYLRKRKDKNEYE